MFIICNSYVLHIFYILETYIFLKNHLTFKIKKILYENHMKYICFSYVKHIIIFNYFLGKLMIITITQAKGGVGKTTIAFNLALKLNEDYQVKIIDLDFFKTLTKLNKIRAQQENKALDSIEIKEQEQLKNIIQNNSSIIYIIDCGGFDFNLNRLAIMGADLILTPISSKGLDLLSKNEYEKIIKTLENIKQETITSYVILNYVAPQTKNLDNIIEFIEKTKNLKVLNNVLKQRADISKAPSLGLSIFEYKTNSKASLEFNNLILEIKTLLNLN